MAQDRYMVDNLGTGSGSLYPLTKMNFIVTVGSSTTAHKAAFSEITGIEATVDVIEFRQGNSENLSPLKIPGLVKHGNVTMKFGYTTAGAHWFFTRRLTTINGLDDQMKAAWAQRICQRGPTFLCFAGKICCTKAASI